MDEEFGLIELTAAINNVPYRPGQVSSSGLFEEDSISTTTAKIEMRDGQLGLVKTSERGGSGETTDDEKRKTVTFSVDHYQRDDSISADESQGVRAFGEEDVAEIVTDRVSRKAQRHARDLTMTLEHQRVGAIKGIVTEKGGNVLHDLYNLFGIAVPPSTSLVLANEETDVGSILYDLKQGLEDDLDDHYDGFRAYTGRNLHKLLWGHKCVRETFLNHSGADILRKDVPDKFEFGGFTWERYKTGAKASADNGAAYIGDDEARVVPVGVHDLFLTRFAPADYNETVNTLGLPFYGRTFPKKNGKGYDLEVQMNSISLCTKPQALRTVVI